MNPKVVPMDMAIAVLAIVFVLVLNGCASRAVWRDELSNRAQKSGQLVLVWLVPVAGAILVLGVLRRDEPASRKYRDPLDAGDDFAMSGRAVKRLSDAIDSD